MSLQKTKSYTAFPNHSTVQRSKLPSTRSAVDFFSRVSSLYRPRAVTLGHRPRRTSHVMIRHAIFYACVAPLVLLSFVPRSQAQQRDREYWRGIVQHKYSIPENESADALARELSTLLGSPDPELRDDLAYSILGTWIHRNVLSQPTLISLTDEWRSNLASGIGESGTNSVLLRSFSALSLSEMAKQEAKSPFMGAQRYHRLVAEATAYLRDERDLRGYDATLHWIHGTAHTADLLSAL